MTMNDLMNGVQTLITAFKDPLFLSFTLMSAIAVGIGVKRLMLE